MEDLTGYPKEDFDSRTLKWTDLVVAEDQKDWKSKFLEALRTTRSYMREYRIRRKDGTLRWLQGRSQIFCDEAGRIDYVSGVLFDITERKLAEREILHFASFPRLNPNPVLEIDLVGKVTYANEYAYEVLRKLGRQDITAFLPSDLEDLIQSYREQGVKRFFREVELEGAVFAESIHVVEEFMMLRLFAIDITERKRAEDALLKYEFMPNTAKDCMTLINRNYIYEATNAAFCQAHGKTQEEVVGTSVANIWGEDRFKNIIKGYLDRCFTGQTVESEGWFEFGKRDRGCYLVFYSPYFNEDGTVAYAAVVSHDLTARKRDEKALRQSEEKYRLLAENVIDVIWTMDLNWKFTYVSPSCESLCGYKDKELVGMTLDQLLTPDSMDLCKKTLTEFLSPENLAGQEYPSFIIPLELRFKDGSRNVYIEVKGSILKDSQGQPGGMLGVTRDITERKRVEESMKENLRLRQQILDTIPSPIFYKGIDGRYQGVNQAFLQFYGKTMEQVLGKTVYEVFCKEIADKYFQLNQHHWQHPGPQIYEYHTYDAQGQRREVVAHNATFMDKNGSIAGLAGVMFDVTEQRQTDKILKHLLNQTQLILDSAAEGILGLDIEGKHIFVNPAATRILGYEEGELIGFGSHSNWHRFRPDGTPYPKEGCRILNYLRKGAAYYAEEVFWKKDGSSFPVDVKANPIIEDGEIIGTVLTFWDISERQQTEAALRQSEQTYRSLVQTIPAVVFKGYEDWSVDFFDEKIEEISGYKKEEFDSRRMKWSDVILPEDFQNAKNVVRRALKTNKKYIREYRIAHKEGNHLWIQDRGQLICDKENNIDYINGVLFNITEMKKLEQDHLMLSKLESLGTLAGGIAHDFNNILTIILGNIGLARLYSKIEPKAQDRLAQAEQACQRAQALSGQLLTFAKGGAPLKKIVSISMLPEIMRQLWHTGLKMVYEPSMRGLIREKFPSLSPNRLLNER